MNIVGKLTKILSLKLLFNISWSIGAEVLAKIIRIATLFALAWALPIEQYGIVMLALVLQDIVRLLMRCGAGAQVIQCEESEYNTTLFNGIILQWGVALALILLQTLLGVVASHFYSQQALFYILALSAPSLIIFPIVCSRVFSISRANQIHVISAYTAISLSCENIVVAISAFLDAGIYSVVYGKYVFAIAWLILFMRKKAPKTNGTFSFSQIKRMLRSSATLVGSEMARAMRLHADLLIAGKLMSPESVGIYSIARNASIGISHSFVNALESALYPHFCALVRDNSSCKINQIIIILIGLITLVTGLQILILPYYMPVLFGQSAELAITTAICLSVAIIPCASIDLYCSAIRARGLFLNEMLIRLISFTIVVCWLIYTSTTVHVGFAEQALYANSFAACCLLIFVVFRNYFSVNKNLVRIYEK